MIFHFFDELEKQTDLVIEIQKIDQEYFPEPWTKDQWDQLVNGKYFLAVGMENGRILNFALFLHSSHEQLVHLLKIVTIPRERKKHLALQLFKSILHNLYELKVERCYLEVNCDNLPALSLYKSLGFKQLNRIPRFYSNGSDAYTMELHLPLNI